MDCPNEGCNVKILSGDVEAHRKVSNFEPVDDIQERKEGRKEGGGREGRKRRKGRTFPLAAVARSLFQALTR